MTERTDGEGVVGCTDDPADTDTATATAAVTGADGPQYDRFRAFDQSSADAYGVKGFLPPNAELVFDGWAAPR